MNPYLFLSLIRTICKFIFLSLLKLRLVKGKTSQHKSLQLSFNTKSVGNLSEVLQNISYHNFYLK